jgi:outer membrane receptor protein involved in Fe transport
VIALALLAQNVAVAAAPQAAQPPAAPTAVDGAADVDQADIVVNGTLPAVPSDAAYGELTLADTVIDTAPRPTFEALLPLIPGAQQFRRSDSRSSNPTAQGLTLRALGGNAASRTLVLRDGVPIADPFFGSLPFSSLHLQAVDGITVTPGAGAGPFGGGAIAGVIEIDSADVGAASAFSGSLSAGSFETFGGSLVLDSRLGQGGVRVALGGEGSDGFWTTPVAQRVPASARAAYQQWSGEMSLSAAAGVGRLDVRISGFDDRRTLRFLGADSHSEGADVAMRWVRDGGDANGWGVEAVGWLQLRDFSATTISATSFRPVLIQRATPSLGWGGKIELRPPIAGVRTLRFGLDMRGADGRTDEIAVAATGAVTARRRAGGRSMLLGAFVEHDVVDGPWTIGAGLRLDHWWLDDGALVETGPVGALVTDRSFADRSGTEWTARAAAMLTVAPDLALRLSAYRGFRVPTLNELYRPFVVFPVTTRANANLSPERLTGIEGGVDYRRGEPSGFALTAFANRVEGAISNVTLGPNLRQRENLPAIRTHGVEFSGRYSFAPDSAILFIAAWTDAQVRGGAIAPPLTGLRPAQTPRFSGSAMVYFAGPGPTTHRILVRHGGRQFEDDRNVDALPAYTALDLSTSLALRPGLSLSLSAENVTGTRIVTRNSGSSIDLGTPRSVRLTLRWN